MSPLLDAALDYLASGYHVLALHGKRPNPRFHAEWDYENSIHGEPTPEETVILQSIFEHKSTTGIAILIPPHVLVADIDTDEAAALYLDLAGEWPHTMVSKTVNGFHAWFLAPGADGSVWIGDRTLLFKGLGGYVVAPPSRHFNEDGGEDGVYTWWLRGAFEYLPEKIAARIKGNQLHAETKALVREDFEQWAFRVEFKPEGGFLLWRDFNMDGLVKAIESAKEGNQNNIIHWAAKVAQEEGVPLETAMEQLLAAAIRGGHPARRARASIKSAYRSKGTR